VAVEPNLNGLEAPESVRILVARLTVKVELMTVTDSYDVEFEIVGVGLIVYVPALVGLVALAA
jgi:hypothetical protein